MASNIDENFEWTNNNEEKLITLWSERPVLYDIKLREFRDRMKKRAANKEISDALSTTDEWYYS